MNECRCDGHARAVEDCAYCSMSLALLEAAGRELVREVESVLRFRASATVTTRRG